jgi:hypothetical protein
MMRSVLIGVVLLLAVDLPALAESLPRPKPRPAELATISALPNASSVEPSPLRSIRPPRREADLAPKPQAAAAPVRATMSGPAVAMTSIRPPRRPDARIMQSAQRQAPVGAAMAAAPTPETTRPQPRGNIFSAIFGGGGARKSAEPPRSVKGSVCGDPAIRGEAIQRITGKVRGCGIEAPVRVTEVDGVRLTSAATLDCDTAKALRNWVSKGLKPAFGRSEVSALRVAAHYACRTRNNRPGARISEHGRGKAIDISGIILANGKEISVLRDYRGGAGAPLRKAHKAACGKFGTTLGPGSDRYHNDHLHFDTARHRGGPYCR